MLAFACFGLLTTFGWVAAYGFDLLIGMCSFGVGALTCWFGW